jgi:putative ABC transport system substrate-binding protein
MEFDRPNRRSFAMLLGAVAWPFAAGAQEAGRTYRLGILSGTPRDSPQNSAFLEQLGQLGFVENKNLVVDGRGFALPFERFAQAALEIVASGVDAIFCPSGDASFRAAQAATRTIPIVGITDDMVAARLVQSLNRPGGNTTGISILAPELDRKRQEILMELLPTARRMAALADSSVGSARQLQELQQMARARGVELSVHAVAAVKDIGPAIETARASGAEAINVLATPLFGANWQPIVERTAALRLPAIYQWPDIAPEGFLAAYGPRRVALFRQLAVMVAKVLRGTPPSEVPVEQPTRFELVVNLKIAKALGLTISDSFLLRADEVIE